MNVCEKDRGVPSLTDPMAIAQIRSAHFTSTDSARFLHVFQVARDAELTGRDSYHAYRHALEANDSVVVAAIIEGVASVPSGHPRVPHRPGYRKPLAVPTVASVATHATDNTRRAKPLSEQERLCLLSTARGLTPRETAARHSLTLASVRMTMHRVRTKLIANNNHHAIALALSTGVITADEVGA